MTASAPSSVGPDRLRQTRRRRRPSGAPPPLPHKIGWTGTGWLVAAAIALVWTAGCLAFDGAARATDQVDSAILRQIARLRTEWLTDVADAIDRAGSGWGMTVVGLGLVVGIIACKRWRHLFTFLGAVTLVEIFGGHVLYFAYARPRPFGVTTIGRWSGYSFPASPVAVLTIVVVGIVYTMVPAGRPRSVAKLIGALVIALFASAALYLATFHPFDVVVAVTVTCAVLVTAFRWFTPNEVFPVEYRRGKKAHLDVTGRRGAAIRQAVHDQLGLTVLDITPVGLAGSGGSTPLRLRVQGNPDTYLFGKLYAMSHVRADRWYKLGRTLLYGRLEDEAPFQGVQRLAEYEDYGIHLMRDAGIATAQPYGIVELTPAREYLLVTEFFDDAQEIGEADVDDAVIDQALLIVRKLWDGGLAHRDIKPANLLVRNGEVLLIDVAFMQLRPSPWRQAVDLANMMLVLAVRTDPERVYQRALQYFTPDEIGEAFAAARGVASPSQLRAVLKRDGRDLIAQFRALAPEHPVISLQRWSPIRVVLAVGVILGAIVAVDVTVGTFTPAHDLGVDGSPTCGTGHLMVLAAQSVPSATSVPCIATLPAGFDLASVAIDDDRTRFSLDSDLGGTGDEFAVDADDSAAIVFDAESALDFQPRLAIVAAVREQSGLSLCGASAPRCPGGRE